MDQTTTLDDRLFALDAKNKCEKIEASIIEQFKQSHCARTVIPISGGLDSSVVASLSTRTIDKDKVIPLMLKERFGNPEANHYGKMLAKHLQIVTLRRNIDLINIHG